MGKLARWQGESRGLRWGDFIVRLLYENEMVSLGDGTLSGLFVVGC